MRYQCVHDLVGGHNVIHVNADTKEEAIAKAAKLLNVEEDEIDAYEA